MEQPSPPLETLGNYDLLEKIAEGGMGTVYKARHWPSKELVAVKVIAPSMARNPVLVRRFEQEFRITSKLDHPNIVRALEYSGAPPSPFLAMELVEGGSIGDRLDSEGRMPETEALRIVVQVAHGLHRAHRQGLIHRDVKPDNILLTLDGTAKVTDLGLAKDLDANLELTMTGRGLGTPNYMAPEQFRNAKSADIRCDVYSLAATLYHMLTGIMPFGEGDPVQLMKRKLNNDLPAPRDIVPSLEERVDWAVRRALSADPEKRPRSCREFVEDLLGQSTRRGSGPEVADAETWFLVFRDAEGAVRTAKGSTKAMRRLLEQGLPGGVGSVKASRSTEGPFEPLTSYPEFRDLVVGPAPGPPLSEMSSANLARRTFAAPSSRKPAAGPSPMARTPSADDDRPTVLDIRVPQNRPVPAPAHTRQSKRWWKTALLVAVTAAATLLVAWYLFP